MRRQMFSTCWAGSRRCRTATLGPPIRYEGLRRFAEMIRFHTASAKASGCSNVKLSPIAVAPSCRRRFPVPVHSRDEADRGSAAPVSFPMSCRGSACGVRRIRVAQGEWRNQNVQGDARRCPIDAREFMRSIQIQSGRNRGRDRCHDRNLTGIDATRLGELSETKVACAAPRLQAYWGWADRRHVDAARR
jgi:hypothetical protein